jgi:hypothetical protein
MLLLDVFKNNLVLFTCSVDVLFHVVYMLCCCVWNKIWCCLHVFNVIFDY